MKRLFFITLLLQFSFPTLFAQTKWTFEILGGEVYNLPMPLTIRQKGFSDLKLTARYRTDALTLPVYWDMRFSRWLNNKSWEFELIHHKLYLDNATPEVQKFNISHGFNMIMVNRGFDKKKFRYRAGAGIVLAHPESKIRGQEFGETTDDFDLAYFISGPVFNLAISKPFRMADRFYINAEVKTTLAYGSIKIAQGHANVYNFAFHIILGIGYDFIYHEKK